MIDGYKLQPPQSHTVDSTCHKTARFEECLTTEPGYSFNMGSFRDAVTRLNGPMMKRF